MNQNSRYILKNMSLKTSVPQLIALLCLFIMPSCAMGVEESYENFSKMLKEKASASEAAAAATNTATLPPPPPPPTEVANQLPNNELPEFNLPNPNTKVTTLRDQAFKQLSDKIAPLTPEQIMQLRKDQDNAQRAVATFPNTPPRPVSSTLIVDLSPGITPPIIRLAAGFVTSIVFLDVTGQAWPIADFNLGNPKNFNIQWDKKTNTMFIQSTTAYNTGNLAIRLATLDTPITLSLVSGQREVDYRIDLQVNGRGPNALPALVGDGLPAAVNFNLLSVLDGVPPPGSTELDVCAAFGRAWISSQGKLIFRTKLTVLSPAWAATVSSADGTHVYEMAPTPLILASQDGKTIKIELKGM